MEYVPGNNHTRSDLIKTKPGNEVYAITSYSNAPWWIKRPWKSLRHNQYHRPLARQAIHPGRRKSSMGIATDFWDFLQNMSLPGYNNLLDTRTSIWERLIWLVLHMTTFTILVVVLSYAWESFVAQYVTINLHDPLYPVEKVPFPAIGICTNNRISLKEANSYAYELKQNDPLNHSIAYFLNIISNLTALYDKFEELVDDGAMQTFQLNLDSLATWDNETFFNTRRIMTALAPKCQTLLRKCFLAGNEIDCFGKNAFRPSLTTYGPCCTFNLEDAYRHRDFKNSFASNDLGLTLILNTSTKDDFVNVLNNDGYVVILHDPKIFPDISSGASRELFPTRGEESFLAVRARIIDTDEGLRTLSPRSRRCYFDDEAPDKKNLIGNSYSFANCITRCRIRSVLALCRCMPFYMPSQLLNDSIGIVYCNLQHVRCLKRYINKWRNILTSRDIIPGLEREREEALYCASCLSSCDDVQYEVSLMSLPTDRFIVSMNLNTEIINNSTDLSRKELSVLRVFFGESYAQYYRRMIGNTWFEAFSTIGNICSIFVGVSLVALCEFIYFIASRLIVAMRIFIAEQRQRENHRNKRRKNHQNRNDVDNMVLHILP